MCGLCYGLRGICERVYGVHCTRDMYEGVCVVCVRGYVGFVRGCMRGICESVYGGCLRQYEGFEGVCGVCKRVSGTCVYEGY